MSFKINSVAICFACNTVHLFSCFKVSKIHSRGLESFVYIYVVILSFVLI